MVTYEPGDILLMRVPFTDAAQTKRRPTLVLRDTQDNDVIVARITSQPNRTPFDVELSDWQAAGLLTASIVRVHKLATLQKSLVERHLGKLSLSDWSKVQTVLRQLWSLS